MNNIMRAAFGIMPEAAINSIKKLDFFSKHDMIVKLIS